MIAAGFGQSGASVGHVCMCVREREQERGLCVIVVASFWRKCARQIRGIMVFGGFGSFYGSCSFALFSAVFGNGLIIPVLRLMSMLLLMSMFNAHFRYYMETL